MPVSDALIRLLLDTGSRGGTPTATATMGDPTAALPTPPPPASTPAVSGELTRLVRDTLPLGNAACVPADDVVTLDIATLVIRFPGVPDAATTLQTLGWQDGVTRVYRCDAPPAGGVGSVDISVHQFSDDASAAAAVPYFANARAKVTQLASAPALQLGDTSAALSGPTAQGTESTLYVSSGPLLFRVTGIAPEGDPTSDVETIMAALVRSAGSDQSPSQPPNLTVPTATATPSRLRRCLPTPSSTSGAGRGTGVTPLTSMSEAKSCGRGAGQLSLPPFSPHAVAGWHGH